MERDGALRRVLTLLDESEAEYVVHDYGEKRVDDMQGELESETVFCGAGVPGKTLQIRPQDLLRVSRGQVAAIARVAS